MKKLVGILVITLLIATIIPATGNINFLKISSIKSNNIDERNGILFIQLPALPADPMPGGWASASLYGPRTYEDFWDISSPIYNIHFWGGAYYLDQHGDIKPSYPEGMKFNIVFYENNNGNPGDILYSYVDVSPTLTSTGIIYDFPEGSIELFYFCFNLNPCCELSEGWVSIQSIFSPTDSGYGWWESLEGNGNSLQYYWGNMYNLSDLSFMLTDISDDPVPDLNCEGSLSWNNIKTGGKITGNFTVENKGEPDSLLHWKIESFPSWGVNWTFTPSASIITPEDGLISVDVEAIAPDKPYKKFTGKVKIVNAVDPSDNFEIPITLKTSINRKFSNSIPIDVKGRSLKTVRKPNRILINNLNTKSFISDSRTQGFASGEFLIKFKHETKIDISKSKNGHVTTGLSLIDILNEKHQVTNIEQLFSSSKSHIDNPFLSNTFKFTVPQDSDILSIIQEYSSNAQVLYAEPNYIGQICNVPNDTNFSLQWAHHNIGQTGGMPDCDIDTPDVWDEITGDEDVVIAIVDTGVDVDHPDLATNIWINTDEALDGSDTDGNGFIDDIHGWDFVNDDGDPIDDNGHGTCCAGIVGADTDNNIGMAGICWDCKIMSIKNLNSDGYGYASDLADGIIYAADNGANVISMSLGFSYHTTIINAVKYAYSQGVVLVGAAGNDHDNTYVYPARCDEVIAVAATYYNDEKMWFSNWGSWVDVAAPGYDIYTVALDDDYEICFGGTSGATPHVAGLVALMLSKNPSLNPDEVKTILRSTTDKVRTNQYIGTGRINAYEAIQRDSTPIADLIYTLDDARVFEEIQINGTASGSTFEKYIISVGKGIYPEDWTDISTSYTPITDSVLATWEPPYPADEMIYSIRLLVYDTVGQVSEDRVIVELNLPPLIPEINGKTTGSTGENLEFTFVTTDPNKDRVHYYIEWGDGNIEDWVGSYPSGSVKTFSHTYNTKDEYFIRCKAKDVHDEESEWGTLKINIPRNRVINIRSSLVSNDLFSNILRLLRLIMPRYT